VCYSWTCWRFGAGLQFASAGRVLCARQRRRYPSKSTRAKPEWRPYAVSTAAGFSRDLFSAKTLKAAECRTLLSCCQGLARIWIGLLGFRIRGKLACHATLVLLSAC
jgi:hypothetical protein